ncbi:GNAT family N-acetyltransferase [Chryseomicrobium sp. FSL W7-1435]|uniref:GNAT family N-acetyltransferase n=1 Tax=Chryseomicrobium sp. FSL W7-1435 TaxID=2921704 RepID=UPI00315A869C
MLRKATPKDAQHLAPLLYDAIHEIAYSLTGASSKQEALLLLAHWIEKPANRLSYENIWVEQQGLLPVGLLVSYTGNKAMQLDLPLQQALRKLNKSDALDVETEGNVLYIDTLSVHPDYGGQGIGTTLLQKAFEEAKRREVEAVTLNVDLTNVRARKLYERLGFEELSVRTISGAAFAYMGKNML